MAENKAKAAALAKAKGIEEGDEVADENAEDEDILAEVGAFDDDDDDEDIIF